MGYDNIGVLFYGILLGDEKLPWDDPDYDGSWIRYYLDQVGFLSDNPMPSGEPRNQDYENFVQYQKAYHLWCQEKYDPWMDRRDAALSAAGCTVGIYNSCHYPYSYIALAVAHHEGDCKPPLELDPTTAMLLPPDADETIRRFCNHMGIEYQQPRWYLTGLYS